MNHASGFNPPNLDPINTWLEDLAIPQNKKTPDDYTEGFHVWFFRV